MRRKHLHLYVNEFVLRQSIRVRDTVDQMKLIVQGEESDNPVWRWDGPTF